jgi:hypothetical protein
VLLRRVIPAFGLLLAEHNAGRRPQRQLRVRVVVSARLGGSVHPGQISQAFPPVSVQVAGHQHEGRVSVLRG